MARRSHEIAVCQILTISDCDWCDWKGVGNKVASVVIHASSDHTGIIQGGDNWLYFNTTSSEPKACDSRQKCEGSLSPWASRSL